MAPIHLLDLPNEVLTHILAPFSTSALLKAALICTKFHDLVLSIVCQRLALAAALKDHKVIFESYHPSHKNIDPYLFCDYLGTPGLGSKDGIREEMVYLDHEGRTGFGRLGNLYSWFRPVPTEELARVRRPAVGQTQTGTALRMHDPNVRHSFPPVRILSSEPKVLNGDDHTVALASYPVYLDHDEGFTQLCMVTNLVKLGPRRGLFEHMVNIVDNPTRLKREWLKNVTASTLNIEAGVENAEEDEMRTIWVDDAKNVGVKVRMKERTMANRSQPLLYRETEPAVSYRMEYDALLIRTTRLLLAVEDALLQDHLSRSAGSLSSLDTNNSTVWDPTTAANGHEDVRYSVDDRIAALARLLLQRDGLVRSETWL